MGLFMGRLRKLSVCVLLLTVALVGGCNNQEPTENQESRIEQGQAGTTEVSQDTASETVEDKPQGEYLCMVWTMCPDERTVPGFLRTDGTWLFEPGAFGWLGNFRYGLAPARCLEWGDYGFIDASGSWVIFPQDSPFSQVREFSEGLAAVEQIHREGWGFIDDNGDYVIEPQFLDVRSFSEGLAWAQARCEQWGAIDKSGHWVIEPRFGHVTSNLLDGHAGHWVIEPRLSHVTSNFLDGYAFAYCPYVNLMGAVDKSGDWVISPIYRNVSRVRVESESEIFASVSTDGNTFWLIDKIGTQIISFESQILFSEGLAAVMVFDPISFCLGGVNTRIIDENGLTVAEVEGFYPIGTFSDGLLYVREEGRQVGDYMCFRSGSRGFVDRDGNWVIGPVENSDNILFPWDRFSEGLSVQRAENGMWGYVDRSGNWAIEPQFERAYRFSQGLAVARTELSSMVIINTDGEAISPIIPLPGGFHNLTISYFDHPHGAFEFRFQETVRCSDASAVLDTGSSSADLDTESIEETGQQVIDSILNGDFSHLVGEWVNGIGDVITIRVVANDVIVSFNGFDTHVVRIISNQDGSITWITEYADTFQTAQYAFVPIGVTNTGINPDGTPATGDASRERIISFGCAEIQNNTFYRR